MRRKKTPRISSLLSRNGPFTTVRRLVPGVDARRRPRPGACRRTPPRIRSAGKLLRVLSSIRSDDVDPPLLVRRVAQNREREHAPRLARLVGREVPLHEGPHVELGARRQWALLRELDCGVQARGLEDVVAAERLVGEGPPLDARLPVAAANAFAFRRRMQPLPVHVRGGRAQLLFVRRVAVQKRLRLDGASAASAASLWWIMTMNCGMARLSLLPLERILRESNQEVMRRRLGRDDDRPVLVRGVPVHEVRAIRLVVAGREERDVGPQRELARDLRDHVGLAHGDERRAVDGERAHVVEVDPRVPTVGPGAVGEGCSSRRRRRRTSRSRRPRRRGRPRPSGIPPPASAPRRSGVSSSDRRMPDRPEG